MTTKDDIRALEAQAEMGNCEAMMTLANDYLYGIGVEEDAALAKNIILTASHFTHSPHHFIQRARQYLAGMKKKAYLCT